MSTKTTKATVLTPAAIVTGICGIFLAVSVFLPWFVPSAVVGSQYNNLSAMKFSALLGVTGIITGLLAIGIVFLPMPRMKGIIHSIISLVALGVLVLTILDHTLPILSSVIRTYFNIGVGLYIYLFTALAVIVIGIMQLVRVRGKVRPVRVEAKPIPVSSQPSNSTVVSNTTTQNSNTPAKVSVRKCVRCGMVAPSGALYCASCGSALPPKQSFCPKCGKPNTTGNKFCNSCGSPIELAIPAPQNQTTAQQVQQSRVSVQREVKQHVSGAWWIMPIILGPLGGLIAFLAVIRRRRGMAFAMLIVGIVIGLIWFVCIRIIMNHISGLEITFS